MKVTVDLIGDKEVARALKKLSDEKKRMVKGEVYASGIDVQREAKERLRDQRTWDLGNLANSIMVDPVEDGMVAEVGPEAPYGPCVEHGTKKHFPPPDALEGWAKRHGFDSAWPICLAIAKRGLKAKPFLFPAWLAVKDKFWKRIKEILSR
ncbi:MAG: HK97 gp10 family phage protein [Candidatus Hydrogenedentota bacterium]|nr:MAG: HK97 gp10 family phage protein [Candidatus Hydrogenedentota bacterium]